MHVSVGMCTASFLWWLVLYTLQVWRWSQERTFKTHNVHIGVHLASCPDCHSSPRSDGLGCEDKYLGLIPQNVVRTNEMCCSAHKPNFVGQTVSVRGRSDVMGTRLVCIIRIMHTLLMMPTSPRPVSGPWCIFIHVDNNTHNSLTYYCEPQPSHWCTNPHIFFQCSCLHAPAYSMSSACIYMCGMHIYTCSTCTW